MSRLSTASADTMLDTIFTGTMYLSLHSGDPSTTGANEISGGSYARKSITFASASGGSKASSSSQSFTSMPAEAGGCPYFGIWDASTAGNFLGGGTTSGLSSAISSGATVSISSGGIVLTEA